MAQMIDPLWTFHEYTHPSAGWDGWYTDENGTVRAFVGLDNGKPVFVEDIEGWDNSQDEPPSYGNIGWKC